LDVENAKDIVNVFPELFGIGWDQHCEHRPNLLQNLLQKFFDVKLLVRLDCGEEMSQCISHQFLDSDE
jgi:hypothetical protein